MLSRVESSFIASQTLTNIFTRYTATPWCRMSNYLLSWHSPMRAATVSKSAKSIFLKVNSYWRTSHCFLIFLAVREYLLCFPDSFRLQSYYSHFQCSWKYCKMGSDLEFEHRFMLDKVCIVLKFFICFFMHSRAALFTIIGTPDCRICWWKGKYVG